MSLNPESTAVGTPQTSPSLGSQTPSHAPSRFHRLKSFSSGAKAPPTSLVPPPHDPLHRLQVSVLISMPSISSRIVPSRDSPAQLPVPPNPDHSEEQHTEDNHVTVEEEEEGAPDVAFGVVVLPWRKEEDDGEIGQTTISVI
ncbi:hypothetical protein JB92DRAFT_3011193 [Gautieria morchelliformis]|nr:hypothetical protein JB92DRAFT_3011193 [Gautieria morchelliformis]